MGAGSKSTWPRKQRGVQRGENLRATNNNPEIVTASHVEEGQRAVGGSWQNLWVHGRKRRLPLLSSQQKYLPVLRPWLSSSRPTEQPAQPSWARWEAIKLWELLTNLVTSGIFYYVTVVVTLICKTSECLDLVAADKNTFSLSFCF